MKKIIRLTERDLTRIVRRVINEVETPMDPQSGNRGIKSQGIKPELVKVLIILAERAFPTVKSALSPVPFKKSSERDGFTHYYGEFNPQNTPALKKNYNVPYEGIAAAEIYFSIQPNGPNAGISGQVLLNTFSFKARLTADEINKYTPNDLYGQVGDGVRNPGGLITALTAQYTGIRNGAGKLELIQRLKEDGFKQES